MLSVRRIVHATDLSTASRNALTWALALAEQHQAELLLLHVLPPPTPVFEAEPEIRPQLESAMASLAKEIRRKGVVVKRLFLKGTIPVDKQIVRSARTLRADLIVMGTNGRSGISRWFTGSVASRVVSNAHCPVLVVRGRTAKAVAP